MKSTSQRIGVAVFALMIAAMVGCKAAGTNKAAAKTDAGTSTSTGNSNSTSAGGDAGHTSTTSATTETNSATNTPAALPDVPGKYSVVGTNPNGSTYKGTLEVIQHGDVYQFRWNAGVQYDGVGVKNGDVVAVSFTGGGNGKGCGVVDYLITSDGTLDGRWGYWGTDESGTEKATRTAGSGLLSTYAATGTNPDGRQYKVNLVVAQFGKLYGFAWSNHTEGIGIERGDHVSVGIGGARCGFVSYEIKSDGTLDGVWGGYGTDKTGTERATKQ